MPPRAVCQNVRDSLIGESLSRLRRGRGSADLSLSCRSCEALAATGNEVTLRLVDGLPHTFFNRSNLDELAGPFRMDVWTHPAAGHERQGVERAGVFDIARTYFTKYLVA
jgi:hypothetical protein